MGVLSCSQYPLMREPGAVHCHCISCDRMYDAAGNAIASSVSPAEANARPYAKATKTNSGAAAVTSPADSSANAASLLSEQSGQQSGSENFNDVDGQCDNRLGPFARPQAAAFPLGQPSSAPRAGAAAAAAAAVAAAPASQAASTAGGPPSNRVHFYHHFLATRCSGSMPNKFCAPRLRSTCCFAKLASTIVCVVAWIGCVMSLAIMQLDITFLAAKVQAVPCALP